MIQCQRFLSEVNIVLIIFTMLADCRRLQINETHLRSSSTMNLDKVTKIRNKRVGTASRTSSCLPAGYVWSFSVQMVVLLTWDVVLYCDYSWNTMETPCPHFVTTYRPVGELQLSMCIMSERKGTRFVLRDKRRWSFNAGRGG